MPFVPFLGGEFGFMDKQIIHQLHSDFERYAHAYESSGDETSGVEYWFARELQKLLGYAQWRNFEPVIEKAIAACVNAGENPEDHFARTRKMVGIGSGAQKEVDEREHLPIVGRNFIHFFWKNLP